jgi:hypothetical protein
VFCRNVKGCVVTNEKCNSEVLHFVWGLLLT